MYTFIIYNFVKYFNNFKDISIRHNSTKAFN